MEWWVGRGVKCDLVSYSGINLTGVRYVVRIHPTGARKGTFRSHEFKSGVVLAPLGTRVVFCTSADPHAWEDSPWRAVRMMEGFQFKNESNQTGVRIPDLDWMDLPEAKKVNPDRQESYPYANRLSDGTTYTFGRVGGVELKNNIHAIIVERESDPWTPDVTEK